MLYKTPTINFYINFLKKIIQKKIDKKLFLPLWPANKEFALDVHQPFGDESAHKRYYIKVSFERRSKEPLDEVLFIIDTTLKINLFLKTGINFDQFK